MTNIVDLKARAEQAQKEAQIKPKEPQPQVEQTFYVEFKRDDGTITHKIVTGVIANLMPMLIIIEEGAQVDPNSAVFILPIEKLQYLEKVKVNQDQAG